MRELPFPSEEFVRRRRTCKAHSCTALRESSNCPAECKDFSIHRRARARYPRACADQRSSLKNAFRSGAACVRSHKKIALREENHMLTIRRGLLLAATLALGGCLFDEAMLPETLHFLPEPPSPTAASPPSSTAPKPVPKGNWPAIPA
jgi:hypothetical protein